MKRTILVLVAYLAANVALADTYYDTADLSDSGSLASTNDLSVVVTDTTRSHVGLTASSTSTSTSGNSSYNMTAAFAAHNAGTATRISNNRRGLGESIESAAMSAEDVGIRGDGNSHGEGVCDWNGAFEKQPERKVIGVTSNNIKTAMAQASADVCWNRYNRANGTATADAYVVTWDNITDGTFAAYIGQYGGSATVANLCGCFAADVSSVATSTTQHHKNSAGTVVFIPNNSRGKCSAGRAYALCIGANQGYADNRGLTQLPSGYSAYTSSTDYCAAARGK